MKKFVAVTSVLAALAVFADAGVAPASTTVKSSKSNSSDRVMTGGTVTEVDARARTFKVMVKGQELFFSTAKMKGPLPKVGARIDVIYTQTSGGPLEASNLNLSKSNID